MRYLNILIVVAILSLHCATAVAQAEDEKLDMPGDNLNLYSALKLFQESKTLEDFEKSLNDEKSNINNLDLNGDNKIDYIRVVDNPDGDVHNITLKIAVSKTEDQDVAVFVVNKEPDGKVQIQVIGDEDLYGKDYIVEPDFETGADGAGTPNPGYSPSSPEPQEPAIVQNTTTTEISMWPVVQFIFVPGYTIWRSPWYWSYYPSYWRPWKPFYWHYYYGYHYHWNYYYNSHYRRWHNYRVPDWRDRYYGSSFRSESPFVRNRFNRGDYRNTYSRPQMAKQGAAMFKRDYPKAPTVNNKLPVFDKTGRPVIARPAVTKPVSPITTRPGVTRPVTKPGITNPVVTPLPGVKPVTKPHVTKPITTNPITTQPITTRPGITKPVTKPVTRPVITNPVITKPPVTKPVTRPITTPVTRPVTQPVTRPVTRPVTQPPVNRPVTRPAVTQPLNRPATPRTIAPRTPSPVKQ